MTKLEHIQILAPFTTLPVSLCYQQASALPNGTVNLNQCYPIRFE